MNYIHFSLLITLSLLVIPYLLQLQSTNIFAKISMSFTSLLQMQNTLIHESFHIIATIITGGKAKSIKLNKNLSGLATGLTYTKWSAIIVTFAGYVGASIYSFFLVKYLLEENYQILFILLAIMYAIGLLFIRNFYGIFWFVLIGSVFYGMYYLKYFELLKYIVAINVFLTMVEAFKTSLYVAKLSIIDKETETDATILNKLTKLPIAFWGLLFGLIGSTSFFFTVLLVLEYLVKLPLS